MVIPHDFRQQMGSNPSKTTESCVTMVRENSPKAGDLSWCEHVTSSPVIYASAGKRKAAGQAAAVCIPAVSR